MTSNEAKKRRNNASNYQKYSDYDLSVLTNREKEILELKISGMTYSEISEKLGITSGAVGVMLQKSREKLNCVVTIQQKYYQENREKIRIQRKEPEYLERKKEYNKAYVRKHQDQVKQYLKEYYQKNRGKILERQKEKRQEKRDSSLKENENG